LDAVVLTDLKKTFQGGKLVAIDGLNARMVEGNITGIIGPDGAGKTTLLRILAGLMTIDSGECLIFSQNIQQHAKEIQDDLGYLPQKFGLYEDLTVSQNLSLYSKLQGVSQKDAIFQRLMEFSGLSSFQKRLVGNLSGGMKQKLGLVTALLRKPKLLLLDEPTIGVDPISQDELWKMIFELNKQGITMVISTSYLFEAEKCHQVILLNEGSCIYTGEPEEFRKSVAKNTFFFEPVGDMKRKVLDRLLGEQGIIDAIVEGDRIRVTFDTEDPERDPKAYGFDNNEVLNPREPNFEDAFIYALGGIPKRPALKVEENGASKDEENVVQAVNLTRYFGEFKAVDNVSFGIRRGEIFGLLGPNGAGKSTTFKMLCGLLRPSNGHALIGGAALSEMSGLGRGMIGYMAQKFSLYDNMTVIQNLRFFSGIYPVDHPKQAMQEMIKVFDLNDYANTLAGDLPLGYKQRLALSCSLMHKPRVLFLDEPTSGVDPLTRREFWHQINVLAASGISVLISTHLMDEAEYCDRIGLIYEGKLRVVGTPQELKGQVPKEISSSPSLVDAFTYFCSKRREG
jgi:ABC-2 type transport system ATP-binding protein